VALVLQKAVSHVVAHAPFVQTAWELVVVAGIGQATQVPSPLPHRVVLVLGWQVPVVVLPQRCVPAAHIEISQTPALLQVRPAPHGLHAPSTVPQVASASFSTQTFPHM